MHLPVFAICFVLGYVLADNTLNGRRNSFPDM